VAVSVDTRSKRINEIIELIDMSRDPWRKVSFYSDDEVQEILQNLYERWRNGGFRGIPLNYASDEELNILLHKAKNLPRADVSDELTLMMFRAIYGEVKVEGEKPKPSVWDHLRRLIFPL